MTPFLEALMVVAVIGGGAFAIVYGLRFFPIGGPSEDQYEMDLGAPKDYPRRRASMAHSIDQMTRVVKAETDRIKAKPPLKKK